MQLIKRSILIFPKFANGQIIDNIRGKYDPLANNVRPHISLVFPFESDITTEELKKHITDSIKDVYSFEVCLKGVVSQGTSSSYLFLNVVEGYKDIIEIHKKLYSGILAQFLPDFLKGINFWPHMTIGNIYDAKDYEVALNDIKDLDETFRSETKEISIEIIDNNEDSIIEFEIELK
jgi:2'-5' RNA ligase